MCIKEAKGCAALKGAQVELFLSQYNNATAVQGPKNYLLLLVNRARIEGIVVFDYAARYGVAIAEMAGYLKDGKMRSKEDIVVGIETFPETFLKLLIARILGNWFCRRRRSSRFVAELQKIHEYSITVDTDLHILAIAYQLEKIVLLSVAEAHRKRNGKKPSGERVPFTCFSVYVQHMNT